MSVFKQAAALLFAVLLTTTARAAEEADTAGEVDYDAQVELSDIPVPFLEDEDIPERVGPFIELGRGINQPGELAPGIEMPTGAVWQPALWVYGFSQTAYSKMDGPNPPPNPERASAEIATRLNLFANLQLTGTERVLLHLRPLDRDGCYTRWRISNGLNPAARPGRDCGGGDHVESNAKVRLFFAEGEIGEMFPRLVPCLFQ